MFIGSAGRLPKPPRIPTAALRSSVYVPPPVVPSWLGNVDEWSSLPNSSLTGSGVGWSGTNPGATNGAPSGGPILGTYIYHIAAWSSGFIAFHGVYVNGTGYVAGPHLVVWGAGHNNYGGNEMYAYGPLTADSPTWKRLYDPTVPGVNTNDPGVARDGSNNPTATHTYDMLQYFPTQQKMICFGGGALYPQGSSYNIGHLYDFTLNPGSVVPFSSIDSSVPSQAGGGYTYYRSGIDLATGNFWGVGNGNDPAKLTRYVPGTGVATHWVCNNPNANAYGKAGIDPNNKIMVFMGESTLRGIDFRSPADGMSTYTITTTGTGPSIGDGAAFEWDNTNSRFVCWKDSGKTLYFLTPSGSPYSGGTAWTWTSVTPSGGATPSSITPSGGSATGRFINGRMRVVEGGSWRGVIVMPNETDGGYVYRLS